MNKYDSACIAYILKNQDIEIINDNSLKTADIIILNTCSVRKKAEERVFNKLKELKNHPGIIGVCGCMAQRLKEKLIERFPFIDFVLGPDNLTFINKAIQEAKLHKKTVYTCFNEDIPDILPINQQGIKTFLPISYGCNNFCSYCIVPYVRGRRKDKPYKKVLQEIKLLVDKGFKEITLLGQDITSYQGGMNLPELLYQISKIIPNNSVRIRFLTSHPKGFTKELIFAIRDINCVCENIHIALQSGSDKILGLMNRKYTASYYKELIHQIRENIHEASITTDIIVGFPTETEADFQDTLRLINEIKFDAVFTFIYSPREGTKAFLLNDDVPYHIKRHRLETLVNYKKRFLQKGINN
jgi:tRNA-2-methylthio-N6-dimethylallyladenosine synthase